MAPDHLEFAEGKTTAPKSVGWRTRFIAALKLVQVRLRLPLCLVLAAIVVGQWETIVKYWDALSRNARKASRVDSAVSSDVEFFCPMDVGVVSNWPGECGICNMALVRRKKGDAVTLPDGVVARMQISPYQIQLAGVRTAAVAFKALAASYQSFGLLQKNGSSYWVQTSAPAMRLAWLEVGNEVEAFVDGLDKQSPLRGRVVSIRSTSTVLIEWDTELTVDSSDLILRPGLLVELIVKKPVAELEPFRSLPRPIPAFVDGEPKSAYLCTDHPMHVALDSGECPVDKRPLESVSLASHQRLRWRCPRHPRLLRSTADEPCLECPEGKLELAIVSFGPEGQVPVVPESAVVDGGLKTTVFVETMEGMFDAVEVILGPRCGDEYPIVKGLEVGQRVAVAGSFLLDAETRLNPSLAAGYFGGSRSKANSGSHPEHSQNTKGSLKGLDGMSPEDQKLARLQKVCPVTGKALGSMGPPIKQTMGGKTIFLCCEGCEANFAKSRLETLGKASAPLK